MEIQENDDMGSLFEGMVLFAPSEMVDDDGADVSGDQAPLVKDDGATMTSTSLSSSQPLDENLFSDLTVITPSRAESTEMQRKPDDPTETVEASIMRTENKATTGASISRQISRRKKRSGLKIGYGRDAQFSDDHPSNSSQLLPTTGIVSTTSPITLQMELDARGEEKEDSCVTSTTTLTADACQSKQVNSHESPPESEVVDVKFKDQQVNSHEQANEVSVLKAVRDSDVVSITAGVSEECDQQKQEQDEYKKSELFEANYEQIKVDISKKLSEVQEMVSSISVARKESRSMRRKAAENVDQASLRYQELEKQLEAACEAEDFETAESLSESLAAAEKEKTHLLNVLRDAEAECYATDCQMQESLERQIAVEDESVSLLQGFSMNAVRTADLVCNNVEVNSTREMDEWFSSIEALEVNKIELEIESLLVNEARSTLNDSVLHLVENDVREKEELHKKKKVLTEELERLLCLVQAKEAEIAENNSKIDSVDKKIADVVSGFDEKQSGIDVKFLKLQSTLSQMETERETLFKRKLEIDDHISQEKDRGAELRRLAEASDKEAKTYLESLVLRKSLLLLVSESREEKERLARTEENILADIEILRLKISSARASIQELTSKKSSIQQEIAAIKQRMLFIDKRIPELEAEKKVAAVARNFKEAARIAAEAKTLSTEKENQHSKMEEATSELGKLEEEIEETTRKMQENEGFVLLKDKEVAVARCQRLYLTMRAASAERSAAMLLGDEEEANKLLLESEAAEFEAKQLQSLHSISEEELVSLPTHVVPMELVSSLDGEQLAELASSVNRSGS